MDPRASIASCLLDDDGQAAETSAFDLSSLGSGLPRVSDAATSVSHIILELSSVRKVAASRNCVGLQVAKWASSIQELALSLDSSEELRTPGPSPSSAAKAHPQPSYDLRNASSLGTIDPFREFHSPEAVRASSSIRPLVVPDDISQQPVPAVSPAIQP